MQGGCSNQDIKIRNEFPSPAKQRTDVCKPFHDRIIERQQGEWRKKLAKGRQVGLWVRISKSHIIDFPNGDVTDGNPFWMKMSVESSRFLLSSQKLDQPIGIKQIGHSNLWSV